MADEKNSSRTIMLVTIGVAVVLSLLIWPLSMVGKGDTTQSGGDDAELRILPVARVEIQKENGKPSGQARDGETIYNTVCTACHAAGLLGAPKTGDKAAWATRIAAGFNAMLKNASNGKGAMPPRGGAADLTDAELRAAVEYLTSKAK